MSENNKIEQLNNIEKALKEDNFLLATSFFNIDLLFGSYEKKRNDIKNTIKNNSNEATAEDICRIFGLEGDNKDFSKLLNAERKKEMDANEYTVVEKNKIGIYDTRTNQAYQTINPGRKLMTYTELTNTLAYNEIFPKIFERAREKIKSSSNISIKDAIKDSMGELTKEIQNAEITEKLEEKIVEDIGGAEEFNKLGGDKEQKIKEINENFKKEYKKQIKEESKEEAENEVYEKYYNEFKKSGINGDELIKKVDDKIKDIKKNPSDNEITKLTSDKINKKVVEFNERMAFIEKQVLENTKNQNFTENTLKRKQKKLKKRIDSFYNMANETLEKNNNRYVTFSERYKMSIMVNKLTLKKVNKEIKWGGEKNNFTKDDINNLKKKFIEEEKELENALKSGNNYNYSKPKEEKNFEKQTRLYIFALSKAYEEGKDKEAANLIKEIEANKELEKNYYRLQFKTAVELGDINGFNKLLEKTKNKKIDIKNFTYDGKSLLNVAAENDSLEMFNVLNDKGFEIDNNLIYTVINSENYDLLEYLVENKKIEDIGIYSYNILSVAAKKGSPKRIETLLKKFEDLNIYCEDTYENSILDVAIKNGNIELVKYLFENEKINQELFISKDKELSEFTTNEELKRYIETKIDPKRLELIIKDEDTKALKNFLEKHKEMVINDKELKNIKDLAIKKEDFQLLNEVRKINEQCLKEIMPEDAEEKRLFNYIISNNSTNIKKQYEIISSSKREDKFSKFPYKNPLIFAIKTGDTQSISSLVDAFSIEDLKKPINNIKFDGTKDESINKEKTIIDFAVRNKNTFLIRKLIQKKGIDINNENINLILQLIINRNSDSLLTSLIDNNKLDLNGKFNSEMSNLEYIMKNGSSDIVKTIIEHPKIDLSGNTRIFEYIRENKNLIDHEKYIEKLKNLQLKKENPEEYEKKLEEKKEKEQKLEEERIKKEEEEQEKMNKIFILHEGLKENNFNLQDFKKFINNEFEKLDLSTVSLSKEAKDNLLLLIAKEGKKDDLKFFKENLNFDAKNIKNSAELNLFFLAIREENIELVKSLIEENKNIINEPLSTGQTPLMLATEWKREGIANYLIENGANIEAKSKEDKNALYYAVKNNNLDLVNSLIEKDNNGINQEIEFADGRKQSLFFIAVEQGNKEIINLFLNKKGLQIDFNEKDIYERTPIYYLIENRDKELLKNLINKSGIDLNTKDAMGISPLFSAIKEYNQSAVDLLIEKGVKIDFNEKDFKKRNILHYAAEHNNAKLMKFLISKGGFDINIKDDFGETPLHYAVKNAVKNKNVELIKQLLEIEGIDLTIKDNKGHTAFDCISKNMNFKQEDYKIINELRKKTEQQLEEKVQNNKKRSKKSFIPKISPVQNETEDKDSKKELNNDKNKPNLSDFRTVKDINSNAKKEDEEIKDKKDNEKGFTFTVFDFFGNNDLKTVKNLDELTDIIYELRFTNINDKTKKDNFENLNNSLIYFIKNTDQEKFKEFLEEFKDRVKEFKIDKRSEKDIIKSFNDNFKELAKKAGMEDLDINVINDSLDTLYDKLGRIAGIEVGMEEDRNLDNDNNIERNNEEENSEIIEEKRDADDIEKEIEANNLDKTAQELFTSLNELNSKEKIEVYNIEEEEEVIDDIEEEIDLNSIKTPEEAYDKIIAPALEGVDNIKIDDNSITAILNANTNFYKKVLNSNLGKFMDKLPKENREKLKNILLKEEVKEKLNEMSENSGLKLGSLLSKNLNKENGIGM